ncbi:MAG TPA: phospholipase D-like domain-containing protein [Bacteroidia bacterium]|nr:phospholipase D-like domain-containing protein [Bacteroidia bacterium]
MRKLLTINVFLTLSINSVNCFAQQNILNKVKVYFNHPVDNSFAQGVNATYLHNLIMDTIAAYINRAKYTVDIAQYDYTASSGDTLAHIATAVNNAYLRGVKVRWIYDGSSPNSGLKLLNASIPTLGSPTGTGYGISHNKFIVIDEFDSLNAIVSDGSEDWSQEMDDDDYNNIVFVQSKVLARAFTNEFNIMWGDTTHGGASNSASSKFGTNKPNSGTHTFTIAGSKFDLYFSPSDGTNTQVINTINSANTDMYLAMYDFTQTQYATPYTGDVSANVYTSCIFDQYSAGSTAYTTMSGTPNFTEYTGKYIYHNKFMVVDPSDWCSDPTVLTGSMNWTGAGYDENDENIILIHNDTIANMYLQSYAKDYETISGKTLTPIKNCAVGINTIDKAIATVKVFPNPFTNSSNITYSFPVEQKVTISVYNTMGQKIVLLADNELLSGGEHSFTFTAPSAGVYFLEVLENGGRSVTKMIAVN